MKKTLVILTMVGCLFSCVQAQELTLSDIYRDSFTYFQLLRQENGIYRDALRFDGNHFHPASIAATGMGLVSLCIADQMQWIPNAEALAETTLKTMTGHTPGFTPDRNASGFFRHWLHLQTGERAWTSEYSTIDTAILAAGANFCKNYFQSPTVASLADELLSSIHWGQSVANPTAGALYLEMNEDGTGKTGSITLPYSEYILVAWMAWKEEQQTNTPGAATELWDRYYADPDQLPHKEYQGLSLLTDNPGRFQSHFTVQFPYYLCHYFTTSTAYSQFMKNAAAADQLWWANQANALENEWGLGAGAVAYSPGYHADAINANGGAYFSPHIIAGFLPVHPNGADDLRGLLQRGQCVYALPGAPNAHALWRKSVQDRSWTANDIQGVDYATLLFGLTTLPEFLGPDFFKQHNNIIRENAVKNWNTEEK